MKVWPSNQNGLNETMTDLALLLTRSAATLLVGIFAGGVFFTVLAPSLADMPGPAYVRYWQSLNHDYARAMPILLLASIACTLAATVLALRRGPVAIGFTAAALVLIVASVVLTVKRMEPLNELANGWDPDRLPADWADRRSEWLRLHGVRSAMAVTAFIGLITVQTLDPIAR